MNMKIARTGLCVVMGGALGVAGLAQAGTVESSKAEAPATVARSKVLDDAQMAKESAGAGGASRGNGRRSGVRSGAPS